MKSRLVCYAVAIVIAVVYSFVIVPWVSTVVLAGGYSCDFKLAVMRQAAEDVINELGPKHPQSMHLRQRLSDAQFDCGWDDGRFRCRTVNK